MKRFFCQFVKYKKPVLAAGIVSVSIIAALSVILLTSPGKEDNVISGRGTAAGDMKNKIQEGTYYMKVPMGEDLLFAPCLEIGKDNWFSFSYDLLSSYMSYGSYEIKGDILTAATSDGLYQYQFKVKEDGMLVFVEKGSSEIKLIDNNFGIAVSDGSEFVKKPKREKTDIMIYSSSYSEDFYRGNNEDDISEFNVKNN